MKTLIITNKYDQSTCDVIDWLRYYNKEHIVLIDETEYSLVKIDMNGSYTLKVNDCILNSNEISSIWFRRGGLHLEPIEIIESSDESISASFCHYYNVASEVLGGFIQNSFLRQKSINNQKYQSVNKLEALQTAKAHGIKVPETIVTTKKTVLKDFISKYKNVITKDFCELNFVNNLPFFTEAQHHNTCLNRKICIDENGDIRNCPAMKKSYGNIRDTTLKEAIEKPGFQDCWTICKDQIDVCKDCEFRYMCTDCRAFIKDPANPYSQPAKCTYNRETGFVPDKEKIAELNRRVWEESDND